MDFTYFTINQSLRKIDLLRKRFLLQSLGKLNMHPNQLPILHYIEHHPGCTQAEIAENLALTPAAITLATQRLQKEGFIEKQVDCHNLRRNLLTLTQSGMARLKETEEIFTEFDRQMFFGFASSELHDLQLALDRLNTNITGETTNEVSMQMMTSLLRQVHTSESDLSQKKG